MPRIRNNNASVTAAAVSDTAGVATTQRGPLHPASQGPLAPAAVFETAAAAARRVTVSDTATVVVPCLKKSLKYSSRQDKAQVLSTLRTLSNGDRWKESDQKVADAFALLEKKNKLLFEDVTKVYKFSNKREALEKALNKFAAGEEQEWDAQWQVVWADYQNKKTRLEERRTQVKAHYEDLETVLAEEDDSAAKVSFASATVKEYVLTEWERVHVKLSEAKRKHQLHHELPWVPSTKYDSFAAVPSESIKRGGTSAYVKDSLDAYSKRQLLLATRDWVRHGNIEALELAKQHLPRTMAAAVSETAAQATEATLPEQSTPSDVVDTSIAIVPQPSVVSETTMASASVTETVAQSTQSPVVSDTTEVQSTQTVVLDTTIQPSVVSDTTEVQSTEPAVVDTAVPAQPLRRSARIAAQNGSGSRVASTSGRNRVASVPLRRTARKGAAKPKGFYKV